MEHEWNVSIPEATRIQKELRDAVSLSPLVAQPRTIAGADVSFGRFSDHFFAAVVVLEYPSLEIIDETYADMRVAFPYVPGFLSFREVPVIAEAYSKLKKKPDLVMMDGQGIAHPRRLGVASHLGLVLDIPTIGCAKSLLYGKGEMPRQEKGSTSPIIDPKDGQKIGAYVRTKNNVKPIIVSPGHRITLKESIDIALACTRSRRIPVPTLLAHEKVNAYRVRMSAHG